MSRRTAKWKRQARTQFSGSGSVAQWVSGRMHRAAFPPKGSRETVDDRGNPRTLPGTVDQIANRIK